MEATFLHGLVAAELDDHEVGGAGEGGRLHVLEAAGEGGDVDGSLLSPPPSKDLDRVENLFCVELGELQQFAIRYPSNQIERLPSILSMLLLPYLGLLCFERRRYDVTQGYRLVHGAVDRRGGDLNAREIRLLLLYVAQLSLGMDNGGKITPLVIVSPMFRIRFIQTLFGWKPTPIL